MKKEKGYILNMYYNRYPFRFGTTQFAAPMYYKEMTSGPELLWFKGEI